MENIFSIGRNNTKRIDNGVFKNISRQVYSTYMYDQFSILLGNREVKKDRINKIKKSFKEIGYISCPIIVNEHLEIIDGQGRFFALKETNQPIEFIVVEGLGIKECIQMNVNMENWKTYDYILSEAARGNENYQRIVTLIEEYKDNQVIKTGIIATAAFNKLSFSVGDVKDGCLIFTEDDYVKAKEKINYIYNEIFPIIKNRSIMRNNTKFFQSVIRVISYPGVDKQKLKEKLSKVSNTEEISISSVKDCIEWIEKLYNRNSKVEYIPMVRIFEEEERQARKVGARKSRIRREK